MPNYNLIFILTVERRLKLICTSFYPYKIDLDITQLRYLPRYLSFPWQPNVEHIIVDEIVEQNISLTFQTSKSHMILHQKLVSDVLTLIVLH